MDWSSASVAAVLVVGQQDSSRKSAVVAALVEASLVEALCGQTVV